MSAHDDITAEIRRYIGLRTDEFKLKAVDGLSVGVSSLLALMTILAVGAIAAAAFAFGLVVLLGELIGSWAISAFIVGTVFLLLLVVLVIFRKMLFRDLFVKLFISIFYEQ
ncbi:MAG: hypothetical protein IJ005_00500 [Bacteroidales bacterium]|nr:hypothetical protein [Bacteroidales bacterium]